MRLIDPLMMEFDREASTTRKCLERVPTEKLGWKPHEKSMSLGQLAWHLATLPHWVANSILADGYDFKSAPKQPSEPAEAEVIVKTFLEGVNGAKAAMVELDDDRALGTWTLSAGEKVLMSVPRLAFVRMILLNHSYHHRGQLSVYLRLLDIPLPSIYGPTADENPFGM
ncbi:MAG: DinB family protein [Thermoanaerobaculia bacterium]|nr:hypothetical protein [Thermoanaerobaculia bacterium]MCK6685194.1 DinB family protein [Thermoanaerobaculia bacterium]